MKTVGEILLEKRKQLALTLDQVEKETKIRKKYLEAIEKNKFDFVSESTTVKGFIRNYSSFLGLSPENILAIFRRDFEETKEGLIVPRGFVREMEEQKIYWTPKATFYLSLVLFFSIFIYFFVRQYLRFSSPPKIEIFSPQENQIYNGEVLVSGKTDKDSTLRINNSLVRVSEDGSFEEKIVLPRGENILSVEVANRQEKKRIVNIKVRVE